MPITRHPPHRSQACGITTPGSCLGSNAEALMLPLVPCPVHSTLFPTSVCRSRPSVQGFPWPRAFSPRTPPVFGLLIRLSTFVRSLHRYYAPVRLPKCVRVGHTATAFSDRTDRDSRSVTLGISRFPCMELAHMPWFSDSVGPVTSLTIAQRLVMPSPS